MFAAMTLQLQTQHSRVSACRRHPSDPVTGICASCLRERLSRFNPADETSAVQTAELRRCKSLSAGKCGVPPSTERRRRSCDVRPRQSLLHLFNLDDQKNGVDGGAEVATKNLGRFHGAVFESTRGHESAIEKRKIRVSVPAGNDGIEAEAKTIKEYIDLELGSREEKESRRDLRDIAGSLLAAASVFSKKLGKWKHKAKKKIPEIGCDGGDSLTEMMDKQLGIGSHGGFGRRSCEVARVSLDGSMCSFDEPRASWDGHSYGRSLIGLNNHLPVEEQASFQTEVGALEVDEDNSVSIPRVATLLNVDGYLRGSRSRRLKDDLSDAAEGAESVNDGDKGKELKNYDRWRKAILGSARRHVTVKCGCDAMCHGGNKTVMSSGKRGGECSREGGGARNGMLIHSESCVAPRNHGKMVGTHHTRSGVAGRGHAGRGSGKKRRQSVRETMHSPGNHENGLLRFYLTPVRTYSRNKSNMNGLRGPRSTARSVSRLH